MKLNQLKIPQKEADNENKDVIKQINENIKIQLKNILEIEKEIIKPEIIEDIEMVLNMANQLIIDCHTLKRFKIGKNNNFQRLVYEYQQLNSKYEIYKVQAKIDSMNQEFKEINKQQKELATESGNLVYNILGFIASFSIVSAAVTAIDKMANIESIMLFMTFTAFILITTLIGLNNFYKGKNEPNKKLQNNYFLWKMLIFVIIGLVIYKGLIFIKDNKDEIFESIGRGIAMYQNEKEN